MTWFITYIISALADLWTTDRAFQRHDSAYEQNKLYRRIFGNQLTRRNMLAAKLAWIGFWAGMMYWGGMPPAGLIVPIAMHLYAAVSNYRLEREQRG